MSLGFDCCWVFLWSVLPPNWLTEGHFIHHICFLLCRWGQVVLKLVLPCVQGFEDSLLLLFSCLFWVISPPFTWNSRSFVGWVNVVSTPSFTFCCYLLVVPLLVGLLFQEVSWCSQLLPTLFLVIDCRGKAKWFKTAGVCSMIFKVPALREEVGDPSDLYGVNHDNSPT